MSKVDTPKGKLVRKFGENIFGNPKYDRLLNRKAYAPGQHGQGRRSKLSNYGIQLQEKQKTNQKTTNHCKTFEKPIFRNLSACRNQ